MEQASGRSLAASRSKRPGGPTGPRQASSGSRAGEDLDSGDLVGVETGGRAEDRAKRVRGVVSAKRQPLGAGQSKRSGGGGPVAG